MSTTTKTLRDLFSGTNLTSKLSLFYNNLRGSVSVDPDPRVGFTTSTSTRDIVLNGQHVRSRGKWNFKAKNLIPNTSYKFYFEGADVTLICKQKSKKIGDGLTSDDRGQIEFDFYFSDNLGQDSSFFSRQKNEDKRVMTKNWFRLVPNNGLVADPTDRTEKNNVADLTKSPGSTYVVQNSDYDYIQTFYADPNAVNGSATISIVSIDLFFKSKPERKNNKSGLTDPGVTVQIIDIENGKPISSKPYEGSFSYRDYNDIFASTDASIATMFPFLAPVKLKTGRSYGVAVTVDDEDYQLWYSREGDRLVGTNTPSPGSSAAHDGVLFQKTNNDQAVNDPTNTNTYREVTDTDLKFNVDIAKYTSNTVTVDLVNLEYEFLTVSSPTLYFSGGEYVYQNTAAETGTITINATSETIIGSGTVFDSSNLVEDDFIVITDGTAGNTDVVKVQSIFSNTEIVLYNKPSFSGTGTYSLAPIGRISKYDPIDDLLVLTESNAKSNGTFTRVFSNNGIVKGIDSLASATIAVVGNQSVDEFISDIAFSTPSLVTYDLKYNFAYLSGNTYYVNTAYLAKLDTYLPNHLVDYDALVASRSLEVQDSTNLHNANKSATIQATFNYKASSDQLYDSPVIDQNAVRLYGGEWIINNDATGEEGIGNAKARHISTKLTFLEGRSAEDIRVYATAHRPPGTDIKIYAKIYNSEDPDAFDDKNWTLLDIITNKNVYAVKSDRNSTVEYGYGFPLYPPTAATLDGVVSTQLSNNIITGVGSTWDTDLANNDIIRIYSPLFENDNYIVSVIESVDSNTQITLTQPIANAGLVGDGFKIDTLSTPYTAFNNITNDYIVRYHNDQGTIFDTYDSVAIKIVLLADNTFHSPYVDDVRVVGVSA